MQRENGGIECPPVVHSGETKRIKFWKAIYVDLFTPPLGFRIIFTMFQLL